MAVLQSVFPEFYSLVFFTPSSILTPFFFIKFEFIEEANARKVNARSVSEVIDELLDFVSCICLGYRKDHGTIGIFES